MIPILFEKTETAFTSSGIGRLVDCIDCKVTEELRSGVYECDFQYPVTGDLFSEIQLGRIVGVTHDDTGDLQPFDIVSCSKPIDGVVSFHAVHISYRLARYIAKVPQRTVSDNLSATNMFDNAYPQLDEGRFTYHIGSTISGYMGATADGLPRSVREWIGGVAGGYLDTYGGEVVWDKFDVYFVASRGTLRDFQIRYGVNMMAYKEEQDGQETYTLAIPFWKGQGNLVVGGLVDSGLTPYDRPLCVALDLTDKFETEPTKAQLEAEALSIMTSGQPNLPRRSIEVDFVRLQDLEDYGDYSDLATCELGDSISVVFPMYNITGTFRIVKVIWDALRDRFDTMTLGSLQTTLAEALGIGGGMTNVGGGGGGGGGSVVQFTQVLSSGTKIGVITIDGAATDIFAPQGGDTVTWTQSLATGTKIAEISINGTSTDVYAPAGGGGSGTKTAWFGTCPTAENVAAKVVTTSSGDFSLTAGSIVFVKFTNRLYTANTTLNVDGTGAVTIKQNGAAPHLDIWQAGETVGFCYDGTNFEMIDAGEASTSAYGVTKLSSSVSDAVVNVAANSYAVKQAYDLAAEKSSVGWTQTQTSGTKIAEIDIDGTTTDVYAPAGGGGGGSYTAESPVSISSSNVISHEDSNLGEAVTAQGSWSTNFGYYMPYITADAKGHVQDLQNLGTLIPVNTSSTSGSTKGQTLMPTSWAMGLRSMISSGYRLTAGSTSLTITVSTDSSSAYAYRTNFRVVDVQAYDATTFEPVIVDWTTDKLYRAGGSITITVSIRSAYSHSIMLFPVLTYANNTM